MRASTPAVETAGATEAGRRPVSRPKLASALRRVGEGLASLELTLAALSALMLLVVVCTLAQARLGLLGAVDAYIRSLFVYAVVPGTAWRVPVFPGGGLVGLVLLANLTAAQFLRLERTRRKAGMWLVHIGLVLLFVGEFVTGFFQRETQMILPEGASRSFVESPRELELVVIDGSDAAFDQVYSVPGRSLLRRTHLEHERWPFVLFVKRYFPNASLEQRLPGEAGPPSLATAGLGPQLVVVERPTAVSEDRSDEPAVFVEAMSGDRSLGTWLLSTQLGAEQTLAHEGRPYRLAFRRKRTHLPFSIALKDFKRELHPGTDIPRHFSSLVRLTDPAKREDRDVLISMNQPLRYGGLAFYQASFAENDTVSILQVVRNPGWTLPYLACALVSLGLAWHFLQRFSGAKP
ncbi:MAG: cytochrome c biogenesis protein ResB [Elusimicrobia bacterium]|nr:cytochrome c biogenesis protein ResB [Elusimicrobiota bacterium]